MKVKNIFLLALLFQQEKQNNYKTSFQTNQKSNNMPIRINATKPRSVGNNTSTRTTGRRSFNRNSFKKGRRNFHHKRNNNTFEQRNSLSAYIAKAQTKPSSVNVDKDGFTVVGNRNITMRTPARRNNMVRRSQNQFNVLSQSEKTTVTVALPKVVAYKSPTGVWGKPLLASVKEDKTFEHVEDLIVEEDNSMVELDSSVFTTEAPKKKVEAMPMLMKPFQFTQNWGDMVDSDDEDAEEYDSMGRPMEDNSAW